MSKSLSLQFVVGNEPSQLKGDKIQRVRSHVSRLGWRAHVGRPRKRPKALKAMIICEHAIPREPSSTQNLPERWPEQFKETPSLEYRLGGGRVDPFQAYPGDREPFIPPLIDHYLQHMAVDISELDQPANKGLLRSRWFPLVLSDLAAFQTILLLSASNSASLRRDVTEGRNILRLKSNAIQSINQSLVRAGAQVSDATIGAVAKMASFEAMHGSLESYQIHMAGLQKMIHIRGGLETLGLGGLLRRIIVWVDLNSSFLLNIPRSFPGQYFSEEHDAMEPNPEGFIAP